jgi:hypothetical protein
MSSAKLERRLTALEAEVRHLKRTIETVAAAREHWASRIFGSFANDPAFREVVRLGREYRQSTRPGKANKRKSSNGRTGHRSR